MSTPVHSEMLGQTSGRDVRTSFLTAGVLALITLLVGSRLLEALENVQSASAPKWILGRSTGLATYMLLYFLTAMGILLSHPRRARWHRPSVLTRIRIHVSLATFTLVFLLSHIVVLATDPYAGVDVIGTLLPFTSDYRPFAVTLGILAVWSGLLSGITAGLASSRGLVRLWWPIHKIAILAFGLTWLHAVLAGTDTPHLKIFYLTTGGSVILLALWRYLTPGQEEHIREISHHAQVLQSHRTKK